MRLEEFKSALSQIDQLRFIDPNGNPIPSHFHLTEIGSLQKHFIDCGGTIRKESKISFQLYTATDYDHRLAVEKMNSIIKLSEDKLGLTDADIEVEYQGETVGKYGLEFNGSSFHLLPMQTDCLAKDKCGIPKQKINLSELQKTSEHQPIEASAQECCSPGSGCC